MRISTKGRYALRIMLDLAMHREDGFVSLKTIADRQEISKKYLDQIMLLLNRSGFLHSERGSRGGYKLARPPHDYTVGDILRWTEGNGCLLACLEQGGDPCPRRKGCMARGVWQGLEDAIDSYLDSLTLQDIIERHGVVSR